MVIYSHHTTGIEALCDRIAILRQGKLSVQGSKGDLPRTVFRIETGSPEQVQKYVTEHLPMASCSAIRNRLYVFAGGNVPGGAEVLVAIGRPFDRRRGRGRCL